MPSVKKRPNRDTKPIAVLAPEELSEALASPRRGQLAVQAQWNPLRKTLCVVMGDGNVIRAPLARLVRRTSPTRPDPRKLSIIDYGQTICLGDYQVAVDGLLPQK